MQSPVRPTERLVLLGGGHAHVQLLRRLVMQPEPTLHVTLVTDGPNAIYSGMVPGVISGQYTDAEATIDLVPLCRRAGVAVVLARATRVDAAGRVVHTDDGRPPLPFEWCSIDIGSTVAGTTLPGVLEHAVPTRPIRNLAARLDRARPTQDDVEVAVVGGGAAGVEVACAVQVRLRSQGRVPRVTLVVGPGGLLPGAQAGPRARLKTLLSARNITVREGVRAAEVHEAGLTLVDGTRVAADVVVWATGAAAHPLGRDSGLPVDGHGWLQTTPTLQLVNHPEIFAAGDCAVLADGPVVPRAGVYAVRAGPVLADNLLSAHHGRPLRPFLPQKQALALLHLGDGQTFGVRGRWSAAGRWLTWWKHDIDVRFMDKFQVLAPDGAPAEAFGRGMPPMAEDDMECGGCAAKLGPDALERALASLPPPPADPAVLAGVAQGDDAALVRMGEDLWLHSVDAFRAFTDDSYLVGRVAAINAMNDLYAKGGRPRFALASVEVPRPWGADRLAQVLAGVRRELDAVGVSLLGGHTTVGEQLRVGLSVMGEPGHGGAWLLSGARVGDALVLTRPLGTGVLLHADMMGRATGPEVVALHDHLGQSSAAAVDALEGAVVHAATDVTGFGLARHLLEMSEASGVSARLRFDRVPVLPGVRRLLAAGERSTFHAQNRLERPLLHATGTARRDPAFEVLFDPQTAGGLALAVPPAEVEDVLERLRGVGCQDAVVVGVAEEQAAGATLRIE